MKNENNEAKYEVGQEVMGFHQYLVGNIKPFCGKIEKILLSSRTHKYNYLINGTKNRYSGTLKEEEVLLFDEKTWVLGRDAWEQHLTLKELSDDHRKTSILYLTSR